LFGLSVESAGFDVIQATKRKPRIMRHELAGFSQMRKLDWRRWLAVSASPNA
jgi:hypothetical protein